MSLHGVTTSFRSRLLARERAAQQAMIDAYRPVVAKLKANALDLAAKLEEAVKAGDARAQGILYRQEHVEDLVQQITEEMNKLHGAQAVRLQSARVAAAREGVHLATAQLALPRLSAKAVEYIVATTTQGPLAELLASLGPGIGEGVGQTLINGITTGLNPRVIAAQMTSDFGLGLSQALTIARTEVIRASRDATLTAYRELGVVQQWMWLSARDDTTCDACWGMDGELFDVEVDTDGHPNCRCTCVPITDPSADVAVPDKAAAWDALGAEAQQSILGPSRFAALDSGEATLRDFATITNPQQWGPSVRSSTLAEAGVTRLVP